jgi:hypothetical protein
MLAWWPMAHAHALPRSPTAPRVLLVQLCGRYTAETSAIWRLVAAQIIAACREAGVEAVALSPVWLPVV